MSFAVWKSKPPFQFESDDREQVYQVGDVWVVTDDPKRATQAEVDAALAPPAPLTVAQKLAAVGLTVKELKAELAK